MRRKVKAGLIEADHDECAIVVHYEIEATVLGEAGEAMVAERTVRQCPAAAARHARARRALRRSVSLLYCHYSRYARLRSFGVAEDRQPAAGCSTVDAR